MERAEKFIGRLSLQSMVASGGALITRRASRGAFLIQKPGILAERHRGKPARAYVISLLVRALCGRARGGRSRHFTASHRLCRPCQESHCLCFFHGRFCQLRNRQRAGRANRGPKLVAGSIEIDHDVITVASNGGIRLETAIEIYLTTHISIIAKFQFSVCTQNNAIFCKSIGLEPFRTKTSKCARSSPP